jgi:hypothetical protein
MSWRALAALVVAAIAALSAASAFAQAIPTERGAAVEPQGAGDEPVPQVLVLLQLPAAHFRPDRSYGGGYGDGALRSAGRRIAAQLAREHGLALSADWAMPILGLDCYVMQAPPGQAPANVAAALSEDARVVWAQPMHVYRGQGHNDPLYPLQPAADLWHLDELHQLATGRDVRIAVIDSRIEVAHPDLAGQVIASEELLPGARGAAETHGTAVAGLIAGRADNGIGIVGVAPGAHLLALRACAQTADGEGTQCTTLSIARALHIAIMRSAEVVNLSLSGPPDRLLARLLDAALKRGMVVVAAVDRARRDGGFPASHPRVIAVSSEPLADIPHAVLAPGTDLPSTAPGGRWALYSGNSYAAAEVSGLMALLREHGSAPQAAADAVALVLLPGGGIDTCATLARRAGSCACGCAVGSAPPPVARH